MLGAGAAQKGGDGCYPAATPEPGSETRVRRRSQKPRAVGDGGVCFREHRYILSWEDGVMLMGDQN